MDKRFLQKVFSNQRTQKYFDAHADESKAIRHYQANIYVSESFYPLLSIFEVALRNALNREMEALFNTPDWYLHVPGQTGLKALNREITLAQNHITKRGEIISGPKIVAELTLGFWVRILNVEYEKVLWKDLRRAFPFMPKIDRQRHKVSAPLNRIRTFRNRIYHNEPVCWNLQVLSSIHSEIYKVLSWLNVDLPNFANTLDRFPLMLKQAQLDLQ